jgi:hypothetical protein
MPANRREIVSMQASSWVRFQHQFAPFRLLKADRKRTQTNGDPRFRIQAKRQRVGRRVGPQVPFGCMQVSWSSEDARAPLVE